MSNRAFGSCRKISRVSKTGRCNISISIDSVFVHKMWDDNELSKMVEGGVPFPMLSDTGGKVGRAYGVFDEDAGVEIGVGLSSTLTA